MTAKPTLCYRCPNVIPVGAKAFSFDDTRVFCSQVCALTWALSERLNIEKSYMWGKTRVGLYQPFRLHKATLVQASIRR